MRNKVQHNDLHAGNIGVLFNKKEADVLRPSAKGSFSLKLLDFGLSELMRVKGWRTRGARGMPTITAPGAWQHRYYRVEP